MLTPHTWLLLVCALAPLGPLGAGPLSAQAPEFPRLDQDAPVGAERLAAHLSRSLHVVVPNAGHGVDFRLP